MSLLKLNKVAVPVTPIAGKGVLFYDVSDGKLKFKNDAGTVIIIGDVATALFPTIADAKGDLIAASAADAMARLAVGSNGQVLTADSAETLGLKWTTQIPASIVDAKGDLIVAQASDDPIRVAVGSNGQRLTADSTTASGVDWEDPARVLEHFRHIGTASPFERWYVAGQIGNSAPASVSGLVLDTIEAIPFCSGRGGTLSKISINVITNGAISFGTGNARLGIYKSTSNTNLYPSALVLDAGTVDVVSATGVKTISISQALAPNSLYWFVIVHDCDVTAPVFRGVATAAQMNILGIGSAMPSTAPSSCLRVAFTYAALPDPFPSGATMPSAVACCQIAVGYSA